MTNRRSDLLTSVILGICFLLTAGVSLAGVGGPYGEYAMSYTGPETLTLLVVPDGSGDPFTEASLPYGGHEDATITLYLKNAGWEPVVGFPREDMWLESQDGGMAGCTGGTIADMNTDAAGMTRWSNPLMAGGQSESPMVALINGSQLELTIGVDLSVNSPDLNGDREVNLTDVQLFTGDFFSAYVFRSDFHRDGVLNLSDIVALSYALGARCP